MMLVTVYYTAPVWATVDTERGIVTRVICGDQELHPLADIFDEGGAPIHDRTLRDKAIAIAESADWPSWEWS
jgi:hypothetical protein